MKCLSWPLIFSLVFNSAYAGDGDAPQVLTPIPATVSSETERLAALTVSNVAERVAQIKSFAGLLQNNQGALQALGRVNVPVTEPQSVSCSQNKDDEDCGPAQNPLKDYSDLLLSLPVDSPVANGPDREECNCIRRNLVLQDLEVDFDEEVKKEKEKLNNKIFEANGKKFINDFAKNFEDASFFLTKNRDVFSDPVKAKIIQCKDPEVFNKKIQDTCAENKIFDQDLITRRKNSLINSVDGGTQSFEERLQSMSEEIPALRIPGKSETFFTRFDYDNARLGTAHSNELGKIADHIVKKILMNKSSHGELIQLEEHRAPGFAILEYLEIHKDDPGFLQRMGFDTKIVKDFISKPEKLKESFNFLMNAHPGFFAAMEDSKVFERLREEASKDPSESILTILENKPSVLQPALFGRCEKLVADFANTVCTKQEELILNTDPAALDHLVHATEPKLPKAHTGFSYHEYVLCDAKVNRVPAKFFGIGELYDEKFPSRKADYLERLLEKDLKKHTNPFTIAMLNSSEEDFRNDMNSAANSGRRHARSVGPGGVVSAEVHAKAVAAGKVRSLGDSTMSKDEARSYLAEAKKYDEKVADQKLASVNNTAKPEYQTQDQSYVTAPTLPVPQNEMRKVSPARDELSRYLSRNNKPEEVKRSLNELPDRDIQEMNQIKNDTASMLAQTLREETKRLQEMQARIEALKAKASETPASPIPAIASTKVETNSELVPETKSKEVSSVILPETTHSTNSQPMFSSASPSAVSAAGASVSPNSRTFAAIAGSTPVSDSRGLIITKEEPVKAEKNTSEINQEIRKFIEGGNLDEKSLDEMKAKGIVFRYSVMENDKLVQKEIVVKFASLDDQTKRLIELKSLELQKTRQVSKLAVLRMLMKN